jgi:hypothetical protein
METAHAKRRPGGRLLKALFLWPVKVSWKIATLVERSTGILLALILAAALLLIGTYLVSTGIGFILGLPMAAVGAILLLRALY